VPYENVKILMEAINLLAPELLFFNYSTPCI